MEFRRDAVQPIMSLTIGKLCSLLLILLPMFCSILTMSSSAAAQLKQKRRVLIINDLGVISSPGFAELDEAILEGLQKSRYQIELYDESLQLTFFPDQESQRAFHDSLVRKYSGRKPDLIIAAGSESFKLITESHETFIRDTPIICEFLEEIPDRSNSGLHLTGVVNRLQPEQTLKTALHLLPGTKHVVVVGGTGKFDEVWERVTKQAFHKYESQLEFTYLTDLTMPALLERLGHLPANTIVYNTSIAQDAAGERFIGSAQSVPLVAGAANAPVFVMDDVDLRAGTVGGALVNWRDAGRAAGELAVRVLNGERPEDIPIVVSKNAYEFDWRALERWHLKETALPPGSIVLNRPPTIWEAYKKYAVTAVLVIVGQTLAIFALFLERTRRRKTQKQLRKSEEKFSKAFHRSPLAFTLVSLTNFRFIEVNDTFERYTGWDRRAVIGRTPLEIDFWVDTGQRSTFIEQLRREGAAHNMEVLFRRKDGQLRTGRVSSELIELNGEPCALSLISDITELKQAEKARYESEERLRLAQQAARIGTFEWNICTGVNTWTQELEEIYGLSRGTFGRTQTAFENLVHNHDRQRVKELIERSFKTRQPTKGEWRVVWPDGSVHWIAGRWQVFTDKSGQPSRMVGVNIDITERKLTEEALAAVSGRLIQAQEQERTRIARELHDDINQRLAMLQIDLERIRQHAPVSDPEFQSRIKDLCCGLSEVSFELQGISHRLHSSKLEYLGLVAACRGFCAELGERQQIRVDFAAEGVPRTLPQEVSLAVFRVLQESLQNATKYSDSQQFEVQLRGNKKELQLTVRDHGKGFDVDAAINGKGLGLISMRERVSLVGGTIAIRSEQNGGTEVEVRVPVVARDSEISEARSGAA